MSKLEMPAAGNLLPGLTPTEILSLTHGLNLPLVSELIELYELRNGVLSAGRYPKDITIYYGYWMLPLQDAINQYHRCVLRDEHDPAWFPVFYCDGDYFHVDCQAATEGKPYVIDEMMENDAKVEYSSLSSMFHTFAECYEREAFIVVDGDMVDHNDMKVNEIGLRNNPDVAYWHEQLKKP